MTNKYGFGAGIAAGILLTILVAIAVWLIVVYTGAYNVAATDRHADLVRWTLDTTMHRSVSSRAESLNVPETFPPELIAAGGSRYASMCAHCHAGPGIERAGWASGMRPMPPHLTEAAAKWEPQEVFWIVQNGIKMSGMPAFGPDHGDEALLEITAFVKQLPGMTPEEYEDLTAGGGHGGGHDGGHGGGDEASRESGGHHAIGGTE